MFITIDMNKTVEEFIQEFKAKTGYPRIKCRVVKRAQALFFVQEDIMTQEEMEKLHPEDLLIIRGNSCWRGTICTFKGLSSRKDYCKVTLYEQIEKEFHRKNLSKAPTVIPVFAN